MRKKRNADHLSAPMARGYFGDPDDCLEMVNRYGTYNIQPTADADNLFPAIAQGLPRSLAEPIREEAERVRKENAEDPKPL